MLPPIGNQIEWQNSVVDILQGKVIVSLPIRGGETHETRYLAPAKILEREKNKPYGRNLSERTIPDLGYWEFVLAYTGLYHQMDEFTETLVVDNYHIQDNRHDWKNEGF